MSRFRPVVLAISFILPIAFSNIDVADARPHRFTIDQRHSALLAKINRAQRSGELTLAEANELRDQNRSIREKENKMMSKNGGRLSYADINRIEERLNDLSNRIHRKSLSKRVD